jgi:UDP-N-acetylglucosamine transferase subunit ALG13
MILVLLGTFPIEFQRPLRALHRLCSEGVIKEEVIVQNGHTPFVSDKLTLRPFIPQDDLLELYDRASLIITHAGTGSLIKGVKKGKKVIAIPRLVKLGEHIDDHQLEILNEFVQMEYVIPWNETDNLEDLLAASINFVPRPYVSKKQFIIDYLANYIDKL